MKNLSLLFVAAIISTCIYANPLILSKSNYNLLSYARDSEGHPASIANGKLFIKNIGNLPITEMSVTATPNIVDIKNDNCPKSLSPSSTCDYNISFKSFYTSNKFISIPITITVKAGESVDKIIVNAESMPKNYFYQPVMQGTDAHSINGPILSMVELEENNQKILYVGTSQGLFKSTDNGQNWISENNNGLPKTEINVLLYNKNDNILYAGTSGKGIYKTIDDGQSWAATGLQTFTITSLAYAHDDNSIYASTESYGIYRSRDNGKTWTSINTGLPELHIISLAYTNKGTIYAGTASHGIYRTTNNGQNWISVNNGLTQDMQNTSLLYGLCCINR